MLKSIKLHTINLSNTIFTSQNQSSEANNSVSKFSTTVNKSFQYSYARTKNETNCNNKNGSAKDQSHQLYSKRPLPRSIIGSSINHVTRGKRNAHRQSHLSPSQQVPSIPIQKSNSNPHSIQTESQCLRQPTKNIAQKNRQRRDFLSQKDGERQKQKGSLTRQTAKSARNHSSMRGDEQLVSSRQRLTIKSRTAPKCNYTNSIIKSYNIKSIQLEHPYERGTRKSSSHHLHPPPSPAPPYLIDFDHQDNLKTIFLEDIEQIELQRLRFENPRMNPNRHCKRRPQTSKLPSKIQDFEPKPWQSEEKQEEMFMKEGSLMS